MTGQISDGLPTTDTFVHGFFSIAQLGQFALAGVAMLARTLERGTWCFVHSWILLGCTA